MKNGYLIIVLILTLSFLLTPLLAIGDKSDLKEENKGTTSSKAEETTDKISLYSSQSKDITEIEVKEYICGVVAAEMPAMYEKEALKAQAICAYTYLCKKLKENSGNEYDITDDSKIDQGYITYQKRKEKWGDGFDEYEKKILSAVESVTDLVITYNGEIIFAAYHALSSGKTENAANVWGGDYPYLTAVESEGDCLSDGYLSEKTVSLKDFQDKLKNKEITLGDSPAEYIKILKRSDSGTVLKAAVGNKELKGSEIREIFDLRSSDFEVEYKEDVGFKFTVKGYGHGVGMSQFGANYLAKQGKTCDEIIKHYYTGVEIVKK